MKIEIKDEDILASLQNEAEHNLIDVSVLLKEILLDRYRKEMLKKTLGVEDSKDPIKEIRETAVELSNKINTRLSKFSEQYDIQVSIEEMGQSLGAKTPYYTVKVEI